MWKMRQYGKCRMWEMRQMCGNITLNLRNDRNVPNVCTDVNECVSPLLNKCSYASGCVNTYGSFHCSCQDGAVLANDGVTCVSESHFMSLVSYIVLVIVTLSVTLVTCVICHADNGLTCCHLCHVMLIIVKHFVIRVICHADDNHTFCHSCRTSC